MPIWFEVIMLALAAYVLGLGAGWLMWGDVAGTASSDYPGEAQPNEREPAS